MDVTALLRAFCDAVERRDGAGFAGLFAEDGVYHDVFYGAFAGARNRGNDRRLVLSHRADFRWDMHDPVTDGHTLYARYAFSYVSTLPEAQGRRVGFEGVAIMKLRDGLIAEYREVANVGPLSSRSALRRSACARSLRARASDCAALPKWGAISPDAHGAGKGDIGKRGQNVAAS